jgi:hypothetical protein
MKTIQPVSVWVNGEVKIATKLECYISFDNMANNATFGYSLKQEVDNPAPEEGMPLPPPMYTNLTVGSVSIFGQDYQDWDDSNDAAYQYIADKLNLVIVVSQ